MESERITFFVTDSAARSSPTEMDVQVRSIHTPAKVMCLWHSRYSRSMSQHAVTPVAFRIPSQAATQRLTGIRCPLGTPDFKRCEVHWPRGQSK